MADRRPPTTQLPQVVPPEPLVQLALSPVPPV